MNLGNYIFSNILDNQYLKNLYKKLTIQYFSNTSKIHSEISLTEKEKIDLLRFADILSKSTELSKRDYHNNIAQSIISMLNLLFPHDISIEYVGGSVLSHVNNYLGLDKNYNNYYNRDFIDYIKECLQRESYVIPCNNEYCFINSQKIAYNRIKQNDYYSFSAPTSMGKTFLIRMFIKECIERNENKNFAIIVPSKALINELTNSIIDDNMVNLVKNNYRVIQSSAAILNNDNCNYIMIFTQERLLQFLLQNKKIKLSYVFIDEAHKMSHTDDRSPFYYKCIELLEKEHFGVKINFSCPNIPNPEVYLNSIKGLGNKAYNCFKYSPVNQLKSIINTTTQTSYIYNDLERNFISYNTQEFCKSELIEIVKQIGNNRSNIVFCNSKKDATNWALSYSKLVDVDLSNNTEISELIKDIKEEIHQDCYLVYTLLKGVAYHVAYLPSLIKEKIEALFRKGIIKTIFCTSTLLEGVNFPANNLFIKLNSKDSWLKPKERASFKNLIGRVGRIDFNSFGNVYCIADNTTDEYEHAISDDIDIQKLSLEKLTKDRKKDIINVLLKGKTTLNKRSCDNFETLGFARKVLNLLLKEIVDDKEGVVRLSFGNLLNAEVIATIKEKFKLKEKQIPKDLLTTADEIEKLDYAITNKGLKYPDKITFENVLNFIKDLSIIFNWSEYESKNDIGNKNRLRYYAVMIMKWMYGHQINQLIEDSLLYAKDNGIYYKYEKPNIKEYLGTPEQINKIINEVLDEVDNILQFKIPNYFQKFSERYKELTNVENINNDWYEFMEYGSNNYIQIKLQQFGLSRECAYNIIKQQCYLVENKKIKINLSKFKTNKYSSEIKRIKVNFPNLIIF